MPIRELPFVQTHSMFRQLCSRAVRRRFMSTDAALLEPEPKQPYRILFFGSDDFSCASLRALMAAPEGQSFPTDF